MPARRVLPLLLVLATVAAGATGCFSSKVASTTISGEITVGEGTAATTVSPGTGGGATSSGGSSTGTTSTGSGSTGASTGTSSGSTTGSGSGADIAAGKASFTQVCGGCHALKDAGTTGNVGPDLDSLAPLTAERVATQIKNGGGPMPPMLLTGKDAANAAAYVASAAGK
jgi:cytochrome c6